MSFKPFMLKNSFTSFMHCSSSKPLISLESNPYIAFSILSFALGAVFKKEMILYSYQTFWSQYLSNAINRL